MLKIDPKETKTAVLHSYLLAAVAPRPIAFASTVDRDGNVNLSPFSFFNVFSANPPIAIFSPARSGRTGKTKHSLDNVKEVPEVVINIVNYPMVQQTSLASTEYPKGVNEFVKAGFTSVPSELVKPPRVKESPVQLECKVREVIELGDQGGAGNLVVCEIVMMHISNNVLNENMQIDQHKIDLVARLGGNWYCRASGNALFEVEKPLTTLGIGVDALPSHIRHSNVLTGNNLGQLGNVEQIPSADEVREFCNTKTVSEAFRAYGKDPHKLEEQLHHIAKQLLDNGKVTDAWKVLLAAEHCDTVTR